jgi:hypothetical protein
MTPTETGVGATPHHDGSQHGEVGEPSGSLAAWRKQKCGKFVCSLYIGGYRWVPEAVDVAARVERTNSGSGNTSIF